MHYVFPSPQHHSVERLTGGPMRGSIVRFVVRRSSFVPIEPEMMDSRSSPARIVCPVPVELELELERVRYEVKRKQEEKNQ